MPRSDHNHRPGRPQADLAELELQMEAAQRELDGLLRTITREGSQPEHMAQLRALQARLDTLRKAAAALRHALMNRKDEE